MMGAGAILRSGARRVLLLRHTPALALSLSRPWWRPPELDAPSWPREGRDWGTRASYGTISMLTGAGARHPSYQPGEDYWHSVLSSLQESSHSAQTVTAAPTTFQVLEICPDGGLQQVAHTSRSLDLASRDVSLFTSKRSHAAISPRGGRTVLFINDLCRAIVSKDKVLLFPCRRRRHMTSIAASIRARQAAHPTRPFKLNALEALLNSTVKHFYNRAKQLSLLVTIVTSNVETFAAPDFQNLLPLQHSVSEAYQDVKELQEATTELVRDDKAIAVMCGWMDTTAGSECCSAEEWEMQAASMLSSYQLQIQVIEGMFEEMQDQLSNSRDVCQMQMASKRNYIIQTNLVLTIANLALLNCTLVSGFFGMNLTSGYEEVPGLFPAVIAGALTATALTFSGIYGFVAWRPRRRAQANIRQHSALRSLMVHHVDDVEDIVNYCIERTVSEETRKTTDITRKQFHELARAATGNLRRQMSTEEIELLFDFFDYDRTGKVEADSMHAMYEKLCEIPEEFAVPRSGMAKVFPGGTRHSLSMRSDDFE
mmetsp:Transcript_596/g.1567  ORF Transcript_596/g.1567 Transcript_596/m.1567 type:complete len:540 (-) Transcript_596:185-1804(-)